MKFLIFEKNEINDKAIQLLKKNGFETEIFISENSINKKEIDGFLIRSYTKITPQTVQEYPNLKYVLRVGVGLDNIDFQACKEKNIQIINSPGSNANAVSELVICFMILLLREIPAQINHLKKGEWRSKKNLGTELVNKTIGLIGAGAIGQLVAKKIQNFSVKEIIAYDPFLTEKDLKEKNIHKCSLNDVLSKSDIISLHLPLNPETKNLINNKRLSIIKKGAYIINTSRGGIINENDLLLAIKNKLIAGAALDVFENEPDFNHEFLKLPNIILTPHIGGFSHEADQAMATQVVENFLKIYSHSG